MKTYVVMTDYHIEGWRIDIETDSFDDAIKARENSMSNGNRNVRVFKNVELIITEKPT